MVSVFLTGPKLIKYVRDKLLIIVQAKSNKGTEAILQAQITERMWGRGEGITGDFEVLNPVNERLAVVF